MSKKLASNVWVGEELFLAGSTPPKEIADQITNPRAWGETDDESDKDDNDATEKAAPAKKSAAARKPSSK